ncbi:MAG: 4Fe-4S cluster-binding domain-containing protein [Chitinivibrionales bacterium]|nr:4Fe-4S cluster-binding domain-containing protein [Chitinivibrionales bacterium]
MKTPTAYLPSLKHLALFLTECCNLRCDYCYASSMNNKRTTPETAYAAVDFLFENAPESTNLHISFWGGEPLLEFALMKELVNYSRSKAESNRRKITFSFPTNATLLNEEILDFTKRNGVSFSLSIDGTLESQAARKTAGGENSYYLVGRSLDLVKAMMGPNLPPIRKTIEPETVGNLAADVRYFLDGGFSNITFSPVLEKAWTEERMEELRRQQICVADLFMAHLLAGQPFHVHLWDEMLAMEHFARNGILELNGSFPCGAGCYMCAVDVEGDIYPCHRFVLYDKGKRKCMLGSVKAGLRGERVLAPYRSIDNTVLRNRTTKCKSCAVRRKCLMLCPATNLALTGDIFTNPTSVCRFRMQMEEILAYIGKTLNDKDSDKWIAYKNELLPRYHKRPYVKSNPFHSRAFDRDQIDELSDKAAAILGNIDTRNHG